jgi:8-oxo-dGTP diphosphatase
MAEKQVRVALKAIVMRPGEVLVLHRSDKEEVHSEMWDIPGGRMHWGEEPLLALAREIKEETGLEVQILDPVSVWQFQASPELQVVGVTFRALFRSGSVVLGAEHDDYRWVRLEEVKDLHMEQSLKAEIVRYGQWAVDATS